jgi:hypothetical protein
VAADINAIKEGYRLRAEIYVGATAAAPKYQHQIDYLTALYEAKFDATSADGGFAGTSTSMEGSTFTGIYPGATPQDHVTAIGLLIRDLQQQLDGATQTTSPRGMRWSSRICES